MDTMETTMQWNDQSDKYCRKSNPKVIDSIKTWLDTHINNKDKRVLKIHINVRLTVTVTSIMFLFKGISWLAV